MGFDGMEGWAVPWWAYAAVGVAWWGGVEVARAAGMPRDSAFFIASALAMATLGGLCLYNARACGAVHCKITGPGFLVAAGLALLGASGVAWITSGIVMTVFWVPVVAGFLLEWIVTEEDDPPDPAA